MMEVTLSGPMFGEQGFLLFGTSSSSSLSLPSCSRFLIHSHTTSSPFNYVDNNDSSCGSEGFAIAHCFPDDCRTRILKYCDDDYEELRKVMSICKKVQRSVKVRCLSIPFQKPENWLTSPTLSQVRTLERIIFRLKAPKPIITLAVPNDHRITPSSITKTPRHQIHETKSSHFHRRRSLRELFCPLPFSPRRLRNRSCIDHHLYRIEIPPSD